VSGYMPGWLRGRPADEQGKRFVGHAAELLKAVRGPGDVLAVENEDVLLRKRRRCLRRCDGSSRTFKLGLRIVRSFDPAAAIGAGGGVRRGMRG